MSFLLFSIRYFDLIFIYFEFFKVFNWLFVGNPSNTCWDGNERVDLPSGCSKCLFVWSVFSTFFTVCGASDILISHPFGK